MPDTFTHIAIPALFQRYIRAPLSVPMVLIGTVLPDYLREFCAFILPAEFYSSIYIFHTIIGACLSSLLLASLFKLHYRKTVFLSILLGECIHLAFDLMQNYLCPAKFYLLFPYRKSFETGLIPESEWLLIFCISFFSFVTFMLIHIIRGRKGI